MNKLFSSVGPHAAMNHYSPTPETDRPITMDEIYLVDSGGQYKVLDFWSEFLMIFQFEKQTALQYNSSRNIQEFQILVGFII